MDSLTKSTNSTKSEIKLPLYPDSIAVSPPNAFDNREVIAVACSNLTGESWHGEICLINGGSRSSKGKPGRRPFLQQKIRTYAGNTAVTWLTLPSSSAPSAPLLLSAGDDSCLYVRSVTVTNAEEQGIENTEDNGGDKTDSSSDSKLKKKKKKKKETKSR